MGAVIFLEGRFWAPRFLLCAAAWSGLAAVANATGGGHTNEKESSKMDMQLVTKKLTEIHPYKRNPRKNEAAVAAVMESIQQCTYIAPIIVDEDGIILAGDTRYRALKRLKRKEAEVIVKAGLSEEQKRKYRLLDNKTNELAGWDLDLLEGELEGLDFGGLDLDWGLGSGEEAANEEKAGDFSRSEFEYSQQYGVTVILKDEAEQEACYNKLRGMGYDCRVVTV